MNGAFEAKGVVGEWVNASHLRFVKKGPFLSCNTLKGTGFADVKDMVKVYFFLKVLLSPWIKSFCLNKE